MNSKANIFSTSMPYDITSSNQKSYQIYEVTQIGLVTGYVTVRIKEHNYYVKVKQTRGFLGMVKQNVTRYSILVTGDINKCKVLNTSTEAGFAPISTVLGDIVDNNTIIEYPDINRNIQAGAVGIPANMFFDETPGKDRNTFDMSDTQARRSEAATRTALFAGPNGGGIAAAGGNVIIADGDGNIGLQNTGSLSTGGDETDHGYMMSTALNFLNHYLIGIANIALPMPHMVNLPKLLSTGVFLAKIGSGASKLNAIV